MRFKFSMVIEITIGTKQALNNNLTSLEIYPLNTSKVHKTNSTNEFLKTCNFKSHLYGTENQKSQGAFDCKDENDWENELILMRSQKMRQVVIYYFFSFSWNSILSAVYKKFFPKKQKKDREDCTKSPSPFPSFHKNKLFSNFTIKWTIRFKTQREINLIS